MHSLEAFERQSGASTTQVVEEQPPSIGARPVDEADLQRLGSRRRQNSLLQQTVLRVQNMSSMPLRHDCCKNIGYMAVVTCSNHDAGFPAFRCVVAAAHSIAAPARHAKP